MDIFVDFKGIEDIFKKAETDNRDFLYEYEVYEMMRLIGSETIPEYHFHNKKERFNYESIEKIPGDSVVLKIVSPYILHKSDVTGVTIVEKNHDSILSAIRLMLQEVPEKQAVSFEKSVDIIPERYEGLSGSDLISKVSSDVKGVLICQFMPPDSNEFGNELLVSLRNTREFGIILSSGLGGTDTELYAKRFRKGEAVVAASTEMTTGEKFFDLFQNTVSYRKMAGLTRGQKRIVTDGQLVECYLAMIALGKYFSPFNNETDYVIEELEINPFAFSNYLMIPLDGLCKFSKNKNYEYIDKKEKIDKLLHPSSICILGVSGKGQNIGKIILQNILANGFNKDNLFVVHKDLDQIEGVQTVEKIDCGKTYDLIILAVGADSIPDLVDKIISDKIANSVLLIPGGLGEKKGSEEISEKLYEVIKNAHKKDGPVFLGGNSLGVLSHPGRYDSLFIPEEKLPKIRGDHKRKSTLISQSGAYMITRMSRLSFLDPAYAISIGNQIDLTAGDIVSYINGKDEIKTICSYMEGFQDLDGLSYAKCVKDAVLKDKEVIFYKAGRTPEGKMATSGHTASLAGDYMVCESCINQAGAIVAKNFTGFEGLIRLSSTLHDKKINGQRLAGVSNAGYEAVGIADNILGEDYKLDLAAFSDKTIGKVEKILKESKLSNLVDVKNPLDITPMAGETVYEEVVKALMEDSHIDALVVAIVPLTPIIETLPDGFTGKEDAEENIAKRLTNLASKYDKPLVIVIDSGTLYDPLANEIQKGGIPVFRSCDQAVWVLGKYIQGRLRMDKIRNG
ncbi:MAG: CoA-binding protein [Desulfobacterales bacterium]|nr:CoA-binding protein [Desulfobacterales bacterium]